MSFVLDASITLAWFLEKPVAREAEHVRTELMHGAIAFVPPLWQLEVANGLVVAERRKIIKADDALQAIKLVEMLWGAAIKEGTRAISIRHLHRAAQSYGLTAYDAMYLELARAEGMKLATLDQRLAEAAVKSGVKLAH